MAANPVDQNIKPRENHSHKPLRTTKTNITNITNQQPPQRNQQVRESSATIARMTNPAKTVWWETYQLWDEVLHQVGKAYYKARPPKKGSRSRARPKSALSRSQRTTGKISSSSRGPKLQAQHEPHNMQLVRQRSYLLDG